MRLAQLSHAQCHIRLEENNRQGQERRDDAADDGNKIKEESQQPKERGKIDLAYGEDDPSAKARPCERARESARGRERNARRFLPFNFPDGFNPEPVLANHRV